VISDGRGGVKDAGDRLAQIEGSGPESKTGKYPDKSERRD
jgi:hypothetical protein